MFALLANSAGVPTFSVANIDASSIRVFDHERRDYPHPFSVSISTAGMTADFWIIAVRIYSSAQKLGDKMAQDQLDLLIPAVDAKVGSTGAFGPSAWEVSWEEAFDAMMAVCLLEVGRQDNV